MSLVIDTSVLIMMEKGDDDTLNSLRDMQHLHSTPPYVTFITYFEFLYGINRRNSKNRNEAFSFIELFGFLSPTKTTASILTDMRIKYEKIGVSFSLGDLFIASQTIENNMVLVTRDKHFDKIDELKKV